ncbi:uncharacterized protein LOC132043132 [Lycium ferocissimum]|uniref:uncharacterized protein LOC132043132 n=1 Tax=Lycium ferocissimum TaxID=112874 RepID=UPI0028158588|nr:uncharacterized protein LOC132043132 [Lycium ferocissimum]
MVDNDVESEETRAIAMVVKDIVSACKIETIKAILEELNGDYFSLLVDESFDVSRKEQMAIVLRYIDRNGFVMDRILDIFHVQDTSALSLKRAIANLLAQHSLSLSYVRGQCYDGASNMQVGKLVVLVSNILNVLGSSFKCMDEFRDSQKERIQEALGLGELTTGKGLNQELGLSRACDTHWGSHFKSFNNFILMFGSILNVLESLVLDARLLDERAKAMGYLEACRTYEVAFILHLMSDVLAITNELNKCLQKRSKIWQMPCYLLK